MGCRELDRGTWTMLAVSLGRRSGSYGRGLEPRWSFDESLGCLFGRGLKGAAGPVLSPLDPKPSAPAYGGDGQS